MDELWFLLSLTPPFCYEPFTDFLFWFLYFVILKFLLFLSSNFSPSHIFAFLLVVLINLWWNTFTIVVLKSNISVTLFLASADWCFSFILRSFWVLTSWAIFNCKKTFLCYVMWLRIFFKPSVLDGLFDTAVDATVLLLTGDGSPVPHLVSIETQGAEEASLYCWMVVGVLSSDMVSTDTMVGCLYY